MSIEDLMKQRSETLETNRIIYREYEALKKTTLDGILEYNEEQTKKREVHSKATEKLNIYNREIAAIDHVIKTLDGFRVKIVKSVSASQSYINSLQKPFEYKSFMVEIPKPSYQSVANIEKQILNILNKH